MPHAIVVADFVLIASAADVIVRVVLDLNFLNSMLDGTSRSNILTRKCRLLQIRQLLQSRNLQEVQYNYAVRPHISQRLAGTKTASLTNCFLCWGHCINSNYIMATESEGGVTHGLIVINAEKTKSEKCFATSTNRQLWKIETEGISAE